MNHNYTESRAADRAAMAAATVALAESHGWIAGIETIIPRVTWVHLRGPRGLAVTVEFSGQPAPASLKDRHCMAWHVGTDSDARLSDAFGIAMGAPVNACHRRKCTAFARGWPALHSRLQRAMELAASGEAFEETQA